MLLIRDSRGVPLPSVVAQLGRRQARAILNRRKRFTHKAADVSCTLFEARNDRNLNKRRR